MHEEQQRRSRSKAMRVMRPALTALALAAAATVAQAQLISSGDVSSGPINVFPLAPGTLSVDLLGNVVYLGSSGLGTLSATGGAFLRADALSLGNGGIGTGVVNLSGAGTQMLLSGISTTGNHRLEVGNWGTGALTVSSGAVIDATAACLPGQRCNSYIGNAAGSNGTMTITGAGSTVSTMYLGIAQSSVFTTAVNGFNFGTPGGSTTGVVNILNGGTLNTQGSNVGAAFPSAAATGTETASGTVVIDGTGSRWVATRDTVNNSAAFVIVGREAGGTGSVVVRNGGQMRIDGAGGAPSETEVLNIGVNGGQGTVTVTGAGSNITMAGSNPFFQVGRSGATGSGTLNVLAGATANGTFMNVGRDGATGTVVVDGAGSQLSLVGVAQGGVSAGTGIGMGFNGGQGQLSVTNGGRVFISDGGADSRPSNGIGLTIGRDASSSGTVNISGAGSVIEIRSTSLGLAPGVADNFNPSVTVGRSVTAGAGSTGTLNVLAGGRLIVQGNAVSTAADPRTTYLGIGGNSDTGVGGTGTALVSGAGSEIRLLGTDAFLSVGRGAGATGSLTVNNGGAITATSMNIGRAGGTGTLLVDGATLNFSGQFTQNAGATSFTVGNRGGTGFATVTNGSQVNVTNLGAQGAGVFVGGTGLNPLGTGTLTLSGGSQINITAASGLGIFSVAHDGTGTANIIQGSTVSLGDGNVHVGRLAGSNGTLLVNGGSQVLAGNFNIGGSSATVAGGVGSATVSGAGSELRASGATGTISVGRFGGNGTLSVDTQAQVTGTVLNVGIGAGGIGTLGVNNGTINLSGQTATGQGASLNIGTGGGTGTASITNGSTVTISNAGSGGASINVGGSPAAALGTGSLVVANSTVTVSAAPGQGAVRIGHDGTGTGTITNSTVNVVGGSLIVGGQPGSVGTLVLSGSTVNTASVSNTGYVGIGATQAVGGGPGPAGGSATLILNNSTINTNVFEIGAGGVLAGNNGVINSSGDVIVAGTISPGESPGRIRINCNLLSQVGSRLILEVESNGAGGFNIDQLIIGNDSTFNLSNFNIVFSFLGDTDVSAFAAAGGFDLDNFLRTGVGEQDFGLSQAFAAGQTWSNVINAGLITVASAFFDVSGITLGADGSVSGTIVNLVPLPPTPALVLLALAVMGLVARRQRAQAH